MCDCVYANPQTFLHTTSDKWFLQTDMDIKVFSSKTYIWRDLEIPAYQIPNHV